MGHRRPSQRGPSVNGGGILAATVHPDLAAVWDEAGAEVVSSAVAVDEALSAREPRGIFLSQDLPGLSPERVLTWAQGRAGRVAVWLEDDAPPAWQALSEDVLVWSGVLSGSSLDAWIVGLVATGGFGMEPAVHLVLDTALDGGGVRRAVRWAQALAARHGMGLMVDADWYSGSLTASTTPEAWNRSVRVSEGGTVRWRLGALWPAPPPWEVLPSPPTAEVMETVTGAQGTWAVVYLGADIRSAWAARWLGRGHDLAWLVGSAGRQVAELAHLLGDMAPATSIGVDGPRIPGCTTLTPEWPEVQAGPGSSMTNGEGGGWWRWPSRIRRAASSGPSAPMSRRRFLP